MGPGSRASQRRLRRNGALGRDANLSWMHYDCLRHLVPLDHSMAPPWTTPSMFQVGPALSVVGLVTLACTCSPLSLLSSAVLPDWVIVNVCPRTHGEGSGSQR